MDDLAIRLNDFYDSLAEYKATDNPSWQVGQMFNALVAAAKERLQDDPVVQAVDLVQEGTTAPGVMGKPIARADAGAMRAVIQQALSALGETGPMIG